MLTSCLPNTHGGNRIPVNKGNYRMIVLSLLSETICFEKS